MLSFIFKFSFWGSSTYLTVIYLSEVGVRKVEGFFLNLNLAVVLLMMKNMKKLN